MADIQPIRYAIQKGDSLSKIAKKYNTTVEEILNANQDIKNPNLIFIGENLNIPKHVDSIEISPTAINSQDASNYQGVENVELTPNSSTNQVNGANLDLNKISITASDASNGNFVNANNLHQDYFNRQLDYEIRSDGIVKISSDGVALGFTTMDNLNNALNGNQNNQNISEIEVADVSDTTIDETSNIVEEENTNINNIESEVVETNEEILENEIENEVIEEPIILEDTNETNNEIPVIDTSEELESIATNIEDSNINETNSDSSITFIDESGLIHYESGYVSPFKVNDDTRITSHVGFRVAPETSQGHGSSDHKGMDISVPVGTEIHAINSGTVINAGNVSGFGKWVQILQEDGNLATYGHVSNANIVAVGTKVEAGDVIALSGNEGNSSGPHLHLQLNKGSYDGEVIDPEYYLR